MSDWKKRQTELPVENEATEAAEPAAEEISTQDVPTGSSHRYMRSGARRGQRRVAALLGFLTILFAVFGVVSLVIFAVLGIHARREEQLDEVAWFVTPLTTFSPQEFEDVNESDQDPLLLSAIYRITLKEQIRQMQEKSVECAYELDDMGRMIVPVKTVEDAYTYLYGEDAVPYHHTIGEEGLSYTYSYYEAEGVYHIPQDAGNSMYHVVYDDLSVWFGTVKVKVGYVGGMLAIDDRGKTIEPTMEDAQLVQTFTLKTTDDGYYIVSVKNEK